VSAYPRAAAARQPSFFIGIHFSTGIVAEVVAVPEPFPSILAASSEYLPMFWSHLNAIAFIIRPPTLLFEDLPEPSPEYYAQSAVTAPIKRAHSELRSAFLAPSPSGDVHPPHQHLLLCPLHRSASTAMSPGTSADSLFGMSDACVGYSFEHRVVGGKTLFKLASHEGGCTCSTRSCSR
jgi:hypothetical protein